MIKYILKKEFLLVFRNLHALGVLFIMPMAFILIMSLALRDTYSNKLDKKLTVLVLSQNTLHLDKFVEGLNKNNYFNFIASSDNNTSYEELIYENNNDCILVIPDELFSNIMTNKSFNINILLNPKIAPSRSEFLKSIISNNILQATILNKNLDVKINFMDNISNSYVYKNGNKHLQPTSVQQSVPAWLVFSMFFILIPISNTFIQEKELGTIDRIKSINVSMFVIIFGKVVPYFIINQIQVVLMILVGMFIVPLLGGDSLLLKGSIFNIFLISSITSITAISFALLISIVSKTTEDATTTGGLSNIILAALGGVMVPKVVMPQFMQDITNYSPMSWALESFLEVFVLGGTLNDFYIKLIYLLTFAIICLLMSFILIKRKNT